MGMDKLSSVNSTSGQLYPQRIQGGGLPDSSILASGFSDPCDILSYTLSLDLPLHVSLSPANGSISSSCINRQAAKDFDKVLGSLRTCNNLLRAAESNTAQTTDLLHKSYERVDSNQDSLQRVKSDSAGTDVSDQGYLVAEHLQAAKKFLEKSDSKRSQTDKLLETIRENVASTYLLLNDTFGDLKTEEEGKSREYSERALDLLHTVFSVTSNSRKELEKTGAGLSRTDGLISSTDPILKRIQQDTSDTIVSKEGRDLEGAIHRTKLSMEDTEPFIRYAGIDIRTARRCICRAYELVKSAQSSLYPDSSESQSV